MDIKANVRLKAVRKGDNIYIIQDHTRPSIIPEVPNAAEYSVCLQFPDGFTERHRKRGRERERETKIQNPKKEKIKKVFFFFFRAPPPLPSPK